MEFSCASLIAFLVACAALVTINVSQVHAGIWMAQTNEEAHFHLMP